MNRKTLIILITAIVILVAGIAVAVVKLFSSPSDDRSSSDEASVASEYELLSAVPADAASILYTGKLEDALSMVTDTTKVFGALFCGTGTSSSFFSFADSASRGDGLPLSSSEAVISIHNRGDLLPLLTVDAGKADEEGAEKNLAAIAEGCGLQTRLVSVPESDSPIGGRKVLLISPSASLLTASQRHIEGGASVMDKTGFNQAALSAGGSDAIFISNAYLTKQVQSYMTPAYHSLAGFFTKMADWLAFSVTENSQTRLEVNGAASYRSDPSYFLNVLDDSSPGDCKAADMLPSFTVYALSLPLGDVSSYISGYRKYIDATIHLDKYEAQCRMLADSVGIGPEQWAQKLDIKEVAKAVFRGEDGLRSVLLIRPGNEDPDIILKGTGADAIKAYKPHVAPYPYSGYASTVFGKAFSLKSETSSAYVGGWIVAGDEASVNDYVTGTATGKTLRKAMSDDGLQSRLPGDGTSLFGYFSVSEYPPILEETFKPVMSKAFRNTLKGISCEPVTLSVTKNDEGLKFTLKVDRVEVSKADATVLERDTTVFVPEGPFKVVNCSTGKTNYLTQQKSNNYLVLKDENMKSMWGIPFGGKLCGAVETIDYYNNGRLQFLFCSGSKLYLLDRLGRFVNPFPVDLGKEVVLGPVVVDITGKKGYRAVVVHKDNVVSMYNLHGQKPKEWKDIKADGVVKTMPEIVESKGKKYWIIRTSVDANVYGFYGGEPIGKLSGNKAFRPDTKFTVSEKGTLSGTCLDGKVRNIKLEK
jgi:hypothetical protein